MRARLMLVLVLLLAAAVSAQEKPVQKDGLTQALAQQTDKLGECNAQLGPLQKLQAAFIGGQLVEPAKAQADFKAKFEAANPGKTLDDAFKAIDAPKEKK
jgi:hypothetical protein